MLEEEGGEEAEHTGNWNGERALTADLCSFKGLTTADDALNHALRGLAAHMDSEGTARDVLVGVTHIHQICTRFGRAVSHCARPVAVIRAFNLCLAWSLY